MPIGLQVANITSEMGASSFFHAFFSTISGNLEPKGWGSRFPALMNDLYQGTLTADKNQTCLREVNIVKEELRRLPPARVIWDYEDRSKSPPWGANIAKDISDLSNYFVTSTGRDLIDTILDALDAQQITQQTLKVVPC
ncbi:MAG: hypothetical protein C0487_05490 [Leptothrix sp. (in: Bacteria)]|nr:hypothetical protein [Leptothrix sp. (in: b-proteobacteria)]